MKVLVIEDEPIYQLYLKKYLEKMGLHVFTCETGMSGIQAARREMPDFVILDMGLPDMIGTDCLDILKKDPDTMHIPVIATTADATDEFKTETLYLGAHIYHRKPITPDQLAFYVQKIRDVLEEVNEK